MEWRIFLNHEYKYKVWESSSVDRFFKSNPGMKYQLSASF